MKPFQLCTRTMLKTWIFIFLFNSIYDEIQRTYFCTNKLAQSNWMLPRAYAATINVMCPCTFCGENTYCHNTEHRTVPVGIPRRQVIRLLLNGNKITEIFDNDFRGMINLEELYLDHNNVTIINENSLQNLYQLKSLHLEHNKLTYIRPGTLKQIPNLINLYLDHNELSTLPVDISYLINLEKLNLAKNQIKEIMWSSFYRLNNVKFLSIQGNPIVCDCQAKQLTNWFQITPTGGSMIDKYLTTRCPKNNTSSLNCTKPTITSISQQSSLYKVGEQAILHCNTTGRPAPLVMWQTPSSGFIYPYKDGRIQAHLNGSLVINKVTRNEQGTYRCYAQLSEGLTDITMSINLRLDQGSLPTTPISSRATNYITTNAKNVQTIQATEGSDIELVCQVQLFPQNRVTWYHSKQNETYTIGSDEERYVLSDNSLIIKQAEVTDEGGWSCDVAAEKGVTQATLFNLTISRVPEEGNTLVIIIGATVGVVVVALIICIAIAIYVTNKRKRRSKTSDKPKPNIVVIPDPLPLSGGSEIFDGNEFGENNLQQPFEFEPHVRGFRL